jgi:hypothetical protein
MPLWDASASFPVEPGSGLIVAEVLIALALIAGFVTALKGRWGWFLLGLATLSLLWFVGAFFSPADGSIWVRARRRRRLRHQTAATGGRPT